MHAEQDLVLLADPEPTGRSPGGHPAAGRVRDLRHRDPEHGRWHHAGHGRPSPAKTPDWRKPDGKTAKAGDGWIYCAYEGVKLPEGRYKTAVYCYGGGTTTDYKYYFFQEQRFYFGSVINDSTGAAIGRATAPDGIRNGPLYSPNVAKAAPAQSNGSVPVIPVGTIVHGNSTYQVNDSSNTGTFLYPDMFDSADDGEVRWVDVEVTPKA